MLRFGILIQTGLLILGVWWCKEILGRWRDDVEELKTSDSTRHGVIIGLWVVTAIILVLMGLFFWNLISRLLQAF